MAIINFSMDTDTGITTLRIPSEYNDGTFTNKVIDTSSLCSSLATVSVESSIKVPRNCRHIIMRGTKRGYLFIYDKCKVEVPLSWYERDIERYGEFTDRIPMPTDTRFGSNRSNIRLFTIPFPPLAFITTGSITPGQNGVDMFSFSNQRVYALTNTNVPLRNMSYYIYPFTNVFSGSWNCCMGHNCMNRVPEDSVNYFPDLVYHSTGNHDLDSEWDRWEYNPNNKEAFPFGEIRTQYHLITELAESGLGEYPIAYNKKLGTGLLNLFENSIV